MAEDAKIFDRFIGYREMLAVARGTLTIEDAGGDSTGDAELCEAADDVVFRKDAGRSSGLLGRG